MLIQAVVASIESQAADPEWLRSFLQWAGADGAWELGLIAFGVAAQTLFFCRWIVQWAASERRGRSHVPVFFWWLSLSGATLLLVYYILRGEPVGILGQCTGWIVYSRNLYLIRKSKRMKSDPV